MGFILDGLDTESYDRKYSDKELLKRILSYLKDYRGKIIIIFIVITLNSITGAAVPVLIGKTIDLIGKNPDIFIIGIFSFCIIGSASIGWILNYIRQRITSKVIGSTILNLSSDAFKKTINHDLSFYDEHSSGKIVSRITSDAIDFSQIVNLITDFFSQILMVIILGFWLVTINAWLTLILFGMAPIAILIALSFRKIARKVTRNSKRIRAKINSQIKESISGIMVAKSFRQEKNLYDKFKKSNNQSYQVGLRKGLVINLIFPVMVTAAGIGSAAIMLISAYFLHSGNMTIGEWVLFLQAVAFFWWPLLNIASFWSQFQDGLSACERVFALIDRESKVKQTGNIKLSSLKGKIEFKNVTFSYNEKETILNKFSLKIPPGETIALVGHTGAGKSSIARLITRFYEFQGGKILLDDKDIRSLDMLSTRQYIGLVPQDPFLFSGTVLDNILYGNSDATDKDARYSAAHIGNGDWLEDLPNGLETNVGHRGSTLSMGQRQLVALSRVLLKNPALFILDEATASVDPFTETQIQEGLDTVMKTRTAIVIAHRLSTVKKADRILVLEKGRIIEEGNHKKLIDLNGHYSTLYNTYFRHQSLEYVETKR